MREGEREGGREGGRMNKGGMYERVGSGRGKATWKNIK